MTERPFPPLGVFPYPRIVGWVSTVKCNLKCVHCYPSSGAVKAEELTTEESKACITEFSSVGIKVIFMSGGEPLLKKDLLELIKHGTNEGITMFLCTNATLLSEKNVHLLKEAGLQRVFVGFEGVNSETVDRFSGVKGTLERKIEGIKRSIAAGLPVSIDFVGTKYNYAELEDVIALARKLGVSGFSLKRFVPTGRGRDNMDELWVEPVKYQEVINAYCSHVLNPDGMDFGAHEPLVTGRLTELKPMKFYTSTCPIGMWCGISPRGEVLPCPMLPIPLGNMKEDSLKGIWENSPFVAKLKDKNALKGRCGTCELRYNCGGCRATAYALSGDCLAEDPNCWKVGARTC